MHDRHWTITALRARRLSLGMAVSTLIYVLSTPALTRTDSNSPTPLSAVNLTLVSQQSVPDWMRRGLPGSGHAALSSLIGTWRVRYEVYGTLGRRGDDPPIVSDDVRTRREWVGGRRFIEDTTEGTLMGAPLWRRGWLGYSNMDRRYEWVTIDSVNPTMMVYVSETGSGSKHPIIMDGAFTDQGVAGEETVGKRVGMRTVIRMDTEDHHVFELYFRRPGQKEVLAVRSVYTRVPK
jgi:hypothetical protein